MQRQASGVQQCTNSPLPPPPPSFLSLNLAPPTITEHSYTLHYQRKHQAMINGEMVYDSHTEEVEMKLKKQLLRAQQNATQSQSTGEKQLRNLQICSKCHKCGYWIQNDQMTTHMSFHVAPVIDNLLLGDRHSSMSKKQLFQRNKVTHILNAAAELKNHFQKEGQVKYLHLSLQDQIDQPVLDQAKQGAQFIKKSLDEGGVVFVHCAMGKSRSVAAIIVYLMLYKGMNYEESIQLVRINRPLAKPNRTYEEELRAFGKTLDLKQ